MLSDPHGTVEADTGLTCHALFAAMGLECIGYELVQWAIMLGVEQGQRWRCRSYNPRNNVIVPYSSTESINSVPLKQAHEKETLLYFRHDSGRISPTSMLDPVPYFLVSYKNA